MIAKAEGDLKQRMYIFNCTQRAHQNYLENMPVILMCLFISGLKYPILATSCAWGWMTFRVIYFLGYTRVDKKEGSGRRQGATFWGIQFFMLGLLLKVAWDMISA
jgi:glutathione S-transferase